MPITPTAPARRDDPVGLACAVAIPILAVAAPVVTVLLLWTAFGQVFVLAGGTPPGPAEQRLAGRLALAAGLVAVGLPVVGFGLAVRIESRLSMWVMAGMAAVGLVCAAVVILGYALPLSHAGQPAPSPSPSSTRSVCQELSGGGNRCPGG